MKEKAIKLYNEFIDMDNNDYSEYYENEINEIELLIERHGVNKAREILAGYME